MSKASKNTSHRKLYTVGGDAPFQFVEAYNCLLYTSPSPRDA